MKKVLLLAMGVVLAANVAFADHLGIYNEAVGTTCTKAVTTPFAPFSVFVVHKFSAGTTASRFKVADTSGLYQGTASTPYAILGTSPYSGVSVAYGSCKSGGAPIMVYDLQFIWFNQPLAACGSLQVVGDPLAPGGAIVITNCNFVDGPGTGGRFYFNPNGTCVDCGEVATEATTWGTIKALYK